MLLLTMLKTPSLWIAPPVVMAVFLSKPEPLMLALLANTYSPPPRPLLLPLVRLREKLLLLMARVLVGPRKYKPPPLSPLLLALMLTWFEVQVAVARAQRPAIAAAGIAPRNVQVVDGGRAVVDIKYAVCGAAIDNMVAAIDDDFRIDLGQRTRQPDVAAEGDRVGAIASRAAAFGESEFAARMA